MEQFKDRDEMESEKAKVEAAIHPRLLEFGLEWHKRSGWDGALWSDPQSLANISVAPRRGGCVRAIYYKNFKIKYDPPYPERRLTVNISSLELVLEKIKDLRDKIKAREIYEQKKKDWIEDLRVRLQKMLPQKKIEVLEGRSGVTVRIDHKLPGMNRWSLDVSSDDSVGGITLRFGKTTSVKDTVLWLSGMLER